MNEAEKLECVAEIFDCDPQSLTAETELDSIGWDSIAMLSVIAVLKSRFNKKLSGGELRALKSVGDLMAVLEK